MGIDRGRHIGRRLVTAVTTMVALIAAPMVSAAPPSATLPKMMDEKTVKAIDKGMEFLANSQRKDGMWYPGSSSGTYGSVMTSLAGLAMIAGGSTPESGPYAKNVRKAMFFMLRVAEANPNGLIAGTYDAGRTMYGHGFGMLFLAQCYGNDLDPKTQERLHKVLTKGVELTTRSQSDTGVANDHAGGWIYEPGGASDEGSVTVTQLQALRACRNVGIKVPKSTIDRAVGYLRISQNKDGGISYSYASRGQSRPPISAAAITCFYAAGVYDRQAGGKGSEAEMVERLVRYCQGKLTPDDRSGMIGGHYYYAHMYYAEALYQRGGPDWEAYYPAMRDKLLSLQAADGSWMGDGVGTTYGTAIAMIILQLPYGYLPICQR